MRDVRIRTPLLALSDDAIRLYENAMTKHLEPSRDPKSEGYFEPIEIERLTKQRYGLWATTTQNAINIKEARNNVRHSASEDISSEDARLIVNLVIDALEDIGAREEAARATILISQIGNLERHNRLLRRNGFSKTQAKPARTPQTKSRRVPRPREDKDSQGFEPTKGTPESSDGFG